MENLTTNQNQSRSLAVTYGLIWTAVNIVLFLLIYYGMPSAMGSMTYSVIQIAIGIGLAIFFTLKIRKAVGGFWSFSEALKAISILFIIPAVVMYFFTVLFGKFIEPSYAEKMTEITLNATTEMLENFSDDQEVIDKAIADTEASLQKQFDPSFMDVLKSVLMSVVIYFVFALIWAAIFKKDRPVFYRPEAGTENDVNVG